MKKWIPAVGLLVWIGAASAAPSPGQKCETGKNHEAGKYAACLHKAEAKLLKTKGACSVSSDTVCYGDADCPTSETCSKDLSKYGTAVSKCETKFQAKWAKLTQQALDKGDACPDGLADSDIRTVVDDCVANVAGALAGAGLTDCNGDLAQCSGDPGTCNSDLDTCTTNRATCSVDLDSCNAALSTSNGNLNTCTANFQTAQSGTATAANVLSGKTFTTFLATLNGAFDGNCFAGHCDWRLPTVAELQSLLAGSDPCATHPCIDPVFNNNCTSGCDVTSCSCTGPGVYWTGVTDEATPSKAFHVDFYWGRTTPVSKLGDDLVRAVRNGS